MQQGRKSSACPQEARAGRQVERDLEQTPTERGSGGLASDWGGTLGGLLGDPRWEPTELGRAHEEAGPAKAAATGWGEATLG